MFFWFLIGTFAALGLLCAVWCVVSLFFNRDSNSILICFCRMEAPFSAITRFRALRALGLMQGILLLVDSGLSKPEQILLCQAYSFIRFCSTAELSELLSGEDALFD